MKKFWMSFVTIGVLVISFPASVLANGPTVPFATSGPILTIDNGDVDAAGNSGRFVVKERTVTGMFYGSIGGTPGVSFTMTYGSNVPIATQSGQVHARLTAGNYEAAAVLASSIGVTPVPCVTPDGATCIATPTGNFIPGLLLNGTATFISGAQGHGTLNGWVIPILNAEGHIVGIYASLLTFMGEWH